MGEKSVTPYPHEDERNAHSSRSWGGVEEDEEAITQAERALMMAPKGKTMAIDGREIPLSFFAKSCKILALENIKKQLARLNEF